MSKLIIKYDAKCKHCKHINPSYLGKRKLHRCSNEKSKHNDHYRRLKDMACEKFKL